METSSAAAEPFRLSRSVDETETFDGSPSVDKTETFSKSPHMETSSAAAEPSHSVDETETFDGSRSVDKTETSSAAAEPFFRCCDAASTITFDGFSDTERNYYSEVGVLCVREYVITEGFLNLLKTLNNGEKVVVIQGPKGVGKSVSLGALTVVSQLPTILFSVCGSRWFQSYLSEKAKKILADNKSEPSSPKKFHLDPDVVESIELTEVFKVITESRQKHVILVDLSTLTKVPKENQGIIRTVLAYIYSHDVIGMVAHSSGRATYSKNIETNLQRTLEMFDRYPTLEFIPFSDQEAKVFWGDNQAVEVKNYKPLTNYNPSLLIKCFGKEKETDACMPVWLCVKKHASDILVSLAANDNVWYENNIDLCMEMLFFATNGLPMPNNRLMQYQCCWLALEGVTYIESKTSDTFCLKVNYPPMVQILVEHFRSTTVTSITYNAIMNGYRFQAKFLTKAKFLHITYNSQECATPTVAFFANVNPFYDSKGMPLHTIPQGSLVQLREKHPVIDAVARVKDQTDKEWLLLIQVSLSTYSEHKSKAGDLKKQITWPESGVPAASPDWTWLQYYHDFCCGDQVNLACMYMYISPKELGPNPANVLAEGGVCSRTRGLYLGLVSENSDTHNAMNRLIQYFCPGYS